MQHKINNTYEYDTHTPVNNDECSWFIHYVFDAFPGKGIDAHTHGLEDLGLYELQIVLPIPQNEAGNILNSLAFFQKNKNIKFEDGDCLKGFLYSGDIYFKKIDDQLRLIFPDDNLKYPWDDGCDTDFYNQIIL